MAVGEPRKLRGLMGHWSSPSCLFPRTGSDPFLSTLVGLGGQLCHANVPTRWASTLNLDYFFSNTELRQAGTLDRKVADHKIV